MSGVHFVNRGKHDKKHRSASFEIRKRPLYIEEGILCFIKKLAAVAARMQPEYQST